jgi:hypothetical protein
MRDYAQYEAPREEHLLASGHWAADVPAMALTLSCAAAK